MKAWKKRAVSCLRGYDTLCAAKENLLTELSWRPDSPNLADRLAKTTSRKWQMDRALAALTPENRMILQLMDISRERGSGEKVCQLLGCEIATVYRRRDQALRQFSKALFGE